MIGGSMKTQFKGANPLDAARKAYSGMSQYFSRDIPKFYFTIQEIKSNKTQLGGGKNDNYYSFEVKEKINDDKEVDYHIKEYKQNAGQETMKLFKTHIKNISNKINKTQQGGKIHYDDSDSDLSDDYYFPPKKTPMFTVPLWYWWYSPQIYLKRSITIPIFKENVKPILKVPLQM